MATSGAPSLARVFYERFLACADRVAFLRGLVNSNPLTFETEWLEFKPHPYKDSDAVVKEIWSKNISAFANTEGGVLVWGIGAKKVSRVDAARNIQLVPDPEELRTRLNELHHQATNPPLAGIEIQSVIDPSANGQGFVLCFIPQGSFVPYRAEYSNMQYYIRVGDDSIVPSPVVLRRLFYPGSRPKFELKSVLGRRIAEINGRQSYIFNYKLTIENKGKFSANELYIQINDNIIYNNPMARGLIPSTSHWVQREAGFNELSVESRTSLHPGLTIDLATSHQWSTWAERPMRILASEADLHIRIDVYCRDTERQSFEVTFVEQDLTVSDKCEKICKNL